MIQLRKSEVGSKVSYGHMWFKPPTNRFRFCHEWVGWVGISKSQMASKSGSESPVGITGDELAKYVKKFTSFPQNQGKTQAEILEMSIWNNITIPKPPKPPGHKDSIKRSLVNRKGFLTLDCNTFEQRMDMMLLRSYYSGYFLNGKPHGYGVQELGLTEELYYGYWKDGLKHGLGMKFWNMNSYIGSWKNGLHEGYGKL